MVKAVLELGNVVAVPSEINDYGFVRIIGDCSHCTGNNSFYGDWDYWVKDYDPEQQATVGKHYFVKKAELLDWHLQGMQEVHIKAQNRFKQCETPDYWAIEQYTCYDCSSVEDCVHAFDVYNLDGACLEMK